MCGWGYYTISRSRVRVQDCEVCGEAERNRSHTFYIVHCKIVSHYNIINMQEQDTGSQGSQVRWETMFPCRDSDLGHTDMDTRHSQYCDQRRVWPAPTVPTQPGAAPAAIIRRVQWIVRAYHLIIIIITVTRCDLPLSLLFITLPITTSHATHVGTGHTSTQFLHQQLGSLHSCW